MKATKILMPLLTVLFAVLMSLPFLFPHQGFWALAGIVPLLIMEDCARIYKVKGFFWWYYGAFVLWNALTTFWVCNATVGGGIFAVLANAAQMALIFAVYRLSQRKFSRLLSLIFLAAMWIAWERAYFDAEISWPWLTLGNAFAYSTRSIQWYEYTGSLGGSLWIWASNIFIYYLVSNTLTGKWLEMRRRAIAAFAAGLVAVIAAPYIISSHIYRNYEERSEGKVNVVIGQPNLDPYQKFESLPQSEQTERLLDLLHRGCDASFSEDGVCKTSVRCAHVPAERNNFDGGSAPITSPAACAGRSDERLDSTFVETSSNGANEVSGSFAGPNQSVRSVLYMGPETFTSDIDLDRIGESKTYQRFGEFLEEYPGASMLYGVSARRYYFNRRTAPTKNARQLREDLWVQSYNAALLQSADEQPQIYFKSKLVVGTEKTPYPKVFGVIDKWLGGVMGRCEGQDEVSVLTLPSGASLGSIVCYESVYGEYCTGYVRKGAQFLTVVTNDAWWGDTPGYRQHFNYSCLRAIETRRDIARCANTGISAFIDQKGDVVSSTSWWEPDCLAGTVNLSTDETFFVRHGDFVGRVCTFMFLLLLLALIVRLLIPVQKH